MTIMLHEYSLHVAMVAIPIEVRWNAKRGVQFISALIVFGAILMLSCPHYWSILFWILISWEKPTLWEVMPAASHNKIGRLPFLNCNIRKASQNASEMRRYWNRELYFGEEGLGSVNVPWNIHGKIILKFLLRTVHQVQISYATFFFNASTEEYPTLCFNPHSRK